MGFDMCFGCSSAIRMVLTSIPAAQPGRALRPPRCWAGSLPRPFLGQALCPPMAGSQEWMGGIFSRTWACFPCPERKLAAWTLPAPGFSTACGSPVTTETWRRGSSKHPWLPSHPLHRRVPCSPARHQPLSLSRTHSHEFLMAHTFPPFWVYAYGKNIPSTPPAPSASSLAPGLHADAEHPT